MKQRRVFEFILLFLTITLLATPFFVTLNDLLTKIVEQFTLYKLLQEFVVPYQVQLVGFVVKPLIQNFEGYKDGMVVNGQILRMNWNCLGWQSLILFIVSSFVGFSGGEFSFSSKLQTLVFGLLGVFWVNILRISTTVILAVYYDPIFRVLFHDYLAAFVTVIFLSFFWWFAYKFVLEEG